MRRRRDRVLGDDEVRLWADVARTVHPLPGRQPPCLPDPVTHPEERATSPGPVSLGKGPPAVARELVLKPLVALERRTMTALRRGQVPIEGVLDLHGLRQAEAHDRLVAFLRDRQRQGARLVLVITGKGAAGTLIDRPFEGDERGVLRRVVPHWLRLPDLRQVVLGFEEAQLGHGGSGALYVRLRRAGASAHRTHGRT